MKNEIEPTNDFDIQPIDVDELMQFVRETALIGIPKELLGITIGDLIKMDNSNVVVTDKKISVTVNNDEYEVTLIIKKKGKKKNDETL